MPVDASSPIPPALDQLREHPEVAPEEVPGLLVRLAEVPGPRDPRGVRHALVVVLALAACAVLAGATSPLAVGEWIADAPPHVLERVGVRLDPLLPKRLLPAGTTVRRLLARIDGEALDLAVGRRLADRRNPTEGQLRGLAVDGKSLCGAARANGRKIHLLAALDHTTGLGGRHLGSRCPSAARVSSVSRRSGLGTEYCRSVPRAARRLREPNEPAGRVLGAVSSGLEQEGLW